jgi:hypothetical protein
MLGLFAQSIFVATRVTPLSKPVTGRDWRAKETKKKATRKNAEDRHQQPKTSNGRSSTAQADWNREDS